MGFDTVGMVQKFWS